ncbi:ABC transporter ATP-binding protein [Azorhizobium oxalatiphilum]|uniref:ABC transporter ATP-binding protein n=2 Tax=Azorhizobium oxalatiphilum TaxID=980631 RepID=A0A917F583_9HYPH|nr:ABC transporter ATP-binding protein [Azorhizobium oxalatiphilum]
MPSPQVVRDVSFHLAAGRTLGIVGESGAGKSVLLRALIGLLPDGMRASGTVAFEGRDLLRLSEADMCRVRGARIGMIFQEPMSALNPARRVGEQIAEGIRWHRGVPAAAARAEALRLLERVRIPDAGRRIDAFPHELSGGQRQRVGIAIALATRPALLLADEPTTALDVTVQAEILDLFDELVAELGVALVIVSHDFGVIARIADDTLVMKDGARVEAGGTADVLRAPGHPYTQRLLAAMPRRAAVPRSSGVAPAEEAPLLQLRGITRDYPVGPTPLWGRREKLRALDGVDLDVPVGSIFGIVGESGSGKSTLARIAMALERPTAGRVQFAGEDLFALPERDLRLRRRQFQMVFQDPYGSLDPRVRIGRTIAEPLDLLPDVPHGAEREKLVAQTLESVGLKAEDARRFPHQFSGGQRQRIAIARAIITRPRLVIADEAVSALDVSVQAQILDLLRELRDSHGITIAFITHNLAVLQAIADHVAVMNRGRIVEAGPARAIFDAPREAYTRRLLAAQPVITAGGRGSRSIPPSPSLPAG